MALRRRVQLLAEDIWDTPDDENRYEVIDGELFVTPPPSLAHQHAVTALLLALSVHVKEHALGDVFTAPIGVVLDPSSGVQPDLVFISRERADIMSERGIEAAPDLAVEILSPSTASRDRGIKMRRYSAAGVQHYWIIDPRSRTLEAYELTSDGYRAAVTLRDNDVFQPALFSGLDIPLADLWR